MPNSNMVKDDKNASQSRRNIYWNTDFSDWDKTVLRRAIPKNLAQPAATPAPIPAPGWYNKAVQIAEKYFHGKGEEVVRILMFLIVGGSAALVNLIAVRELDAHAKLLPFWSISAISTEISILYNFALNDQITFRSMTINSGRPIWLRCARFHLPASVGFALTLILATSFHTFGHLSAVIAQAIAIIIVTGVNFVMHRFWTFRPSANTAPAKGH